ncbi:MAG: hypothetical protein MJB14_23535, partial [Spirochaetes bacterium]|nr:hypothetical protein [Spirochaetota bacterium]
MKIKIKSTAKKSQLEVGTIICILDKSIFSGTVEDLSKIPLFWISAVTSKQQDGEIIYTYQCKNQQDQFDFYITTDEDKETISDAKKFFLKYSNKFCSSIDFLIDVFIFLLNINYIDNAINFISYLKN